MQSTEKEGKGYPWLFFHLSGQQKLTLLVSLVIVAISVGFFLWCTDVSDDRGGDSFVGLVFALTSMIFLSLAAVAFSLQRRARKRSVGELNAVLNWHICFGMIALVMVFLHADGNYNPRTGTYALYALVALVISGMVGRTLDRLMPRLIAQEVHKALTAKGEDRIKSISHTLRSVSVQKSQELSLSQPSQSSAPDSGSLGGAETPGEQGMFQSWDIAYVSLEDRPQDLNQFSDCTVAGGRSVPIRSGVFSPDTKEQIGALEEIEQAHERELFFRYSIRYWRIFHRVLAMVTVGLTLWHIEYALALIIPAFQKFGLSYLLPWP
jgi:hypothetical protein